MRGQESAIDEAGFQCRDVEISQCGGHGGLVVQRGAPRVDPGGFLAVRVVETSLHQLTLRTRLPFRYGITTLTECPHLLCRVTLDVDGRTVKGIAADNLPPKWFTKDPS